jgi:hypothetical protein
MQDFIMTTESLPEPLLKLIHTDKILIKKTEDGICLIPIPSDQSTRCTKRIRGMFAGSQSLSVDKFLEQKHLEKDLER